MVNHAINFSPFWYEKQRKIKIRYYDYIFFFQKWPKVHCEPASQKGNQEGWTLVDQKGINSQRSLCDVPHLE